MVINPFILLNGEANQAIEFYCQSLDLKCTFKNTYENSPMPVSQSQKHWILHSELSRHNERFLMIADVNQTETGNIISLSLNFEDLDDMRHKFNSLSKGGKITRPIENQFWNAHYGELIDKFGIHWMFNCQNKNS
ncbi:MAG: glyoxalase/bleomycin resistance/extradiol dioxygenase family protein [Flavobacteriaceae bacterium]|nr:glyoxalase/bleomycin resistance/extradiol dioxygenase family protein [Flavobacteriaceae bacterium]MCY4217540.1 glyoxalase/bleomycin resistance/extradiol dioxygenase family protein [Flavobacteriaceae bacterium]MCY4254113.1 glyoxalase/bleomycin resistance/extradiol dioxygenase family protein [Flavobacteriaceae bacterium]